MAYQGQDAYGQTGYGYHQHGTGYVDGAAYNNNGGGSNNNSNNYGYDGYNAGYGGHQGYSDPYTSANSYPPAPAASYDPPYADYNDPRGYPEREGRHTPSSYADEKATAAPTYGNLGPSQDSEATLAGEYEAKRREGFQPSQQTRGSVAAQLAAEGQIPEKAGLRMWRSDEHAGTFTQGGRRRCCGRCCCCTLIIVFLLLVGIIAAFLLWVRPPNITFNGIEAPSSGSEVSLVSSGFQLNFNLNVGVTNPNFFGAKFSKIEAKAFYPTNKTQPLGGGSLEDVHIKAHSNTTIHFPFQVNYTTSLDPDKSILTDLATKCGFLGSSASKISVDYTLQVTLKIVAIKISPSFSSSTSFDCPLTESDIASVLGSSSSSLSGLLGSLSGGSTGRLRERGPPAAAAALAWPTSEHRQVMRRGQGYGYAEWKRRLEEMAKRWFVQ